MATTLGIKLLWKKYKEMSFGLKTYAGITIPLWLSFTIYMLIGIPIL